MPSRPRQLTYEEAVFAWAADWQPDVRSFRLAEDGVTWVRVNQDGDEADQ